MNPFFIDAAIVVLLLFTLWSGYRKGFVLTLCGFLALFVALIGASIAANILAEPVAELIQPAIERGIQEYVSNGVSASPADPQNAGADLELPLDSLLHFLEKSDLWYSDLAASFRAMVTPDAVSNALADFSHYIAVQIARIVLFILAFIVIQIAWFLLSHALDLAFKLPVLSTLNALSGAVLGLVKGMVLVYIAVWLLKDSFVSPEMMDGSKLLPFFAAGPAYLFSMISQ